MYGQNGRDHLGKQKGPQEEIEFTALKNHFFFDHHPQQPERNQRNRAEVDENHLAKLKQFLVHPGKNERGEKKQQVEVNENELSQQLGKVKARYLHCALNPIVLN